MIRKTQGFVLKAWPFKETSAIVCLYTRDFGKIKVIAKGAKRPRSRFSALDALSLNNIVFYEARRGGINTLSSSELVDEFPELRGDLKKISYGSYFTELINSFTEDGDKNEEAFELYLWALKLLSRENESPSGRLSQPKKIARIFEAKLLSALGLIFNFRECAACGGALGAGAKFSALSGGTLCRKCGLGRAKARALSLGSIKVITHIAERPLRDVRRLAMSRAQCDELEGVLKEALEYHLSRELKSRKFIEKIEAVVA